MDMKHPNWPVYELVTVTAPPGISLALPLLHVPRSFFGGYRADNYLSPIATRDRPNLLRFGRSVGSGIFCLDVTSGEVVKFIVDRNGRIIEYPCPGVEFVNSSLEQFNRSIEVLTELFPYDDNEDHDEYDWDAAAARLAKALEAIDER
jgi:hypothetical protein